MILKKKSKEELEKEVKHLEQVKKERDEYRALAEKRRNLKYGNYISAGKTAYKGLSKLSGNANQKLGRAPIRRSSSRRRVVYVYRSAPKRSSAPKVRYVYRSAPKRKKKRRISSSGGGMDSFFALPPKNFGF